MKITKDRIIFIIIVSIIVIILSSVTTYATSYLYNSSDVSYDNETSQIESDNVQGAIDELYTQATNYNDLNTRVTTLENTENYKIVNKNYSSVKITTKSANGAYYVSQETYTPPTGYTVASILITDWTAASASFVPYYQASVIRFSSDVSQTVGTISIRILLVKTS